MADVAQCAGRMCLLHEVGDQCTSRCNNCGTLCEAFPIRDLASLQLYRSKGCTIVTGNLHIENLPSTVLKRTLFDNLKAIKEIRGVLYFTNNVFISALTFFSGLEDVDGVVLLNNPQLVDASMPSLLILGGDVVVEGCDRLCPARYPRLGASGDVTGCSNPQMSYSLSVKGSAEREDVELLGGVLARVIRNVTNGEVCVLLLLLCCRWLIDCSGAAV